MNIKQTTLRERFFSRLASIRKRDRESKNKSSLVKQVMKSVGTKRTA